MTTAPGAASKPDAALENAVTEPAAPVQRTRGEFLFFALRSKKFLISFSILSFLILLAIFGPIIDSADPVAQNGVPMRHPTLDPGNWFGTTYFGEDVFAQFVNGLRASFFVGLVGGGLAALIGMVVGFTAGYRGGWTDEILNMITNVFLVIPTLAVLLVITSYLSARGVAFEAIFIGLTSWPWAARAIRAQTFSLRSRDFVDLAKLSGRRGWKIIATDVAPNMSSYLFLTFILLFGGAILIAASLDFIGLGPTGGMSLGLMMFNAVTYGAALLLGMWWWFIPPGVGIVALVGALYVMNVGLDEIFNPKLRTM
ncbi:MAG TPA: ABC transporter permease [Candidatus Limnocylindrales bacterium]|nr:ABC transporter permease [Candidatus Limnocylindrales bacterium]